jgi:hypothetical protein
VKEAFIHFVEPKRSSLLIGVLLCLSVASALAMMMIAMGL